jgi:hypothetical protein
MLVELDDAAQERFLGNIDFGGDCWMWRGMKDADGYGRFRLTGNRRVPAHRMAWMLQYGRIPTGMLVCPHCDTPGCVRPAHLFVGTAIDNNADRDRKGRTARGIPHPHFGMANGRAKLTETQVKAIRGDPRRNVVIAQELGVTPTTISLIRHCKVWKQSAGAR